MKFLTVLSLVFTAFFTVAQVDTSIPANALFTEDEHKFMLLSPDGKYITSYDKDDDVYRLDLIDIYRRKATSLLKMEADPKLFIKKLSWLDNNHLYIEFPDKRSRLSKDNIIQGIIKINIADNKVTSEFNRINLRGTLISTQDQVPNKVLYKLYDKGVNTSKAYYISIADLIAGNRDGAEEFPRQNRSGYSYYHYDKHSKVLWWREADFQFGLNYGFYFSLAFYDTKKEDWIVVSSSDDKLFERDKDEEKIISFKPVGLVSNEVLAVLTNFETNLVVLQEYNFSTKTFGKILYQHSKYDLIGAKLNSLNQGIKSVSFIEYGVPKTEYFSQKNEYISKKLVKTFPNKEFSVIAESDDENIKLLAMLGSDTPVKYFYYNDRENKIIYIKDRKAILANYSYAKTQIFHFPADDGEEIEAYFTPAIGKSNGVLLVNPHGGPVGVRDVALFDPEKQYYASRGYSILNVNFRGSAGFGKKFMDQGRGQFGKRIEQDITAAVKQLEQTNSFKYKCAIGGSYGGYSAMMLAIKHPDDYQCVVSQYGVFDLPHLFNASNFTLRKSRQKSIRRVIGKNNKRLNKVSPFYIAEKVNTPVLLIAGEEDEIAPIEQSHRMFYRLKQLNKEVEYFPYQQVGHGQRKWEGKVHEAELIDNFISRKLNIKREPSNQLAEQLNTLGKDYSIGSANSYKNYNISKAIDYFTQAANMGNARAMNELGDIYSHNYKLNSKYTSGNYLSVKNKSLIEQYWLEMAKLVPKNMEKAIHWYEKSSKAGEGKASITLANIYYTGFSDYDGKKNRSRAITLYQEAKKQGIKEADFYIARAKCLGEEIEKDIDTCLALLFTDFSGEETINRSIIAQILHSPSFTGSDRNKLTAKIKSYYQLPSVSLALNKSNSGYIKIDSATINNDEYIGSAEKSLKFMIDLDIKERESGSLKETDTPLGVVRVHWYLPKELESQNKHQLSAVSLKNFVKKGYYRSKRIKRRAKYTLTFDHPEMLIEGDWTVKVYSLNDELLFEKTFTTSEVSPATAEVSTY